MTAGLFEGYKLAVAGGQFLVIRPRTNILLADYLRWFLNLPSTQETLVGRARGSYVRSLPASALGELEIPIPPLPQQHAIAALRALRLREKDLMARLASHRALLFDQSILHSFRA
jgi:restriction endonuclease S subunit